MQKRFLKKPIPSFRARVYKAVKNIPRGKVLSYKQVAVLAGKPRAWRAVGGILNKNNSRTIPCHRVIKSDSRAGGYRKGVREKINLLKKEGLIIHSNGKVAQRLRG